MAAYSSVFKRVEKKYRIGTAERIYPASFTKYGNAYQLAAGASRIGRGVQTQICSEGRSRKIFSGKMSEKLELLGFG